MEQIKWKELLMKYKIQIGVAAVALVIVIAALAGGGGSSAGQENTQET